jgi:uncharacterized protein YndB with AHSA1/START domain
MVGNLFLCVSNDGGMPLTDLTVTPGAVRLSWSLKASPAHTWAHLTDREQLPTWLGALASGQLRTGERIVVDHGEGYECASTITRLEPGAHLAMTWEFPDEPESMLAAHLEPAEAGDECLLVLTHSGLGELTKSYAPGWMTHLTYFEASLGGHPLPAEVFWRLYESFAHLDAHGSTA